ncbi:hypothetical protein QTO34_010985 [Cnephaeus nilssonii]|uniref:B30.2/SPRY domain-containing protein n=1 Tax=Cnephaeus nilssonii TaxID=3371016 RepID=A0AA40LD08_CNENI|nr:hypothetical protein QTO34_010985 [Eptesicus nilssonii]
MVLLSLQLIPMTMILVRSDVRARRGVVGVTLDPETAHPELILSKDQRQVTRGGCPEGAGDPSPRRFTYFEVDVGEGMGWDVGVCLESVQRVVGTMQTPEAGFWALRLCAKDGYVALTWPRTPLGLQEQPLVVGVLLDCEVRGCVLLQRDLGLPHLHLPQGLLPGRPAALFPGLPVFPLVPAQPRRVRRGAASVWLSQQRE